MILTPRGKIIGARDIREGMFHTAGERLHARMERYAVAGQSLMPWGQRFCPDYFSLPPGEHHHWLGTKLVGMKKTRGQKLLVVSPRESSKSTYISFLDPLNDVCEELEKYIGIIADTYGQAVKHLTAIKTELESNEDLARVYPKACGKGPVWSEDGIVTRNGIRIEALGTGQRIRGRREGASRFTKLIIDDPQGEEVLYSPTQRQKDWDWLMRAVMRAGTAGHTNFIASGTMIHRDCIVGRLWKAPGWQKQLYQSMIEYPEEIHGKWEEWKNILCDFSKPGVDPDIEARAYFEHNKLDMLRGSKVLWEAKEDCYALMYILVTEGKPAFQSEKQNHPVNPDSCEWSEECFTGDDIWFDEWPDNCLVRTMSLDPSKGRKDKPGDYQAIIKLGIKDSLLYVEADIKRRPIPKMIEAFVDHAHVFQPNAGYIEAVQFQECLVREADHMALETKLVSPIFPIDTEGIPKPMRIRRLGPYVNRRRIRYKRRSPGTLLLLEQMQDFPNGDHDDGPDAFEMAVRGAAEILGNWEAEKQGVENPY